jgi:hypothetical protein
VLCCRRLFRRPHQRFDEEVIALGVLECQLRDLDTPRVLTDIGAFWVSQSQGRNVLSYRTRAQPGNLRNLPGVEFVVPRDPSRWVLFGPTGRPVCGIDQMLDHDDSAL